MGKVTTNHEDIVDYWSSRIYEGDMGCDWDEALNRCWRCGTHHNTKSLNRCHIIPALLGGKDTPSNLILLCGPCHAESPSVASDDISIWHWIKNTSSNEYDTFWPLRSLELFERIFNRKPNVTNFDANKYKNYLDRHAGIHLGHGVKSISLATTCYALKASGL